MATELNQKIDKVKGIWPDDERLRQAIVMAWGSSEQLPILNELFQKTLLDMPAPGEDTVKWEMSVHLCLSDVIRWMTTMELSLHDLRQALFFRYNKRVIGMKQPTATELEEMTTVAEETERVEANKLEAKAAASVEGAKPKEKKPKEDKSKQAAKAIGSLFSS